MLPEPITIYLRKKDCYCHNCDKDFHHLGIASHRATHRRKNEDCVITYSDGKTFKHLFSQSLKSINGVFDES